jgi:predicted DCC family thiol-disulfide oxidoreductase YuxK
MLIYDGDCGFCRRSLRWARAMGATCPAVPYQVADLAAYHLTPREAADAVWFVAEGKRWRGHEAIAMVLRSSRWPLVRWTAVLLGLRPLRPLVARAYAWVAANRRRLP